MDYSAAQLAIVCCTVAVGSVVQGTVGFASGMFVTPVLVVAGWALPTAIGVNLVSNMVQSVFGAYQLRRAIDWHGWLRPNAIRLAFLPLGAALLIQADQLDPVVVRQLVGALILVFAATFWLWHVEPKPHLPTRWEYVSMSSSGFLAGLCGIGGPPLVLWIVSQDWPPQRARVFLFTAFSISIGPQMALILWLFQDKAATGLMLGAMALPAALAGTSMGLWLGNRLPREPLRQLMLAVLAIVAAAIVVTPWFLPSGSE